MRKTRWIGWAVLLSAGMATALPAQQGRRSDQDTAARPAVSQFDAADLIGTDIINEFDEDLGDVEDLIVDLSRGQVVSAVISHRHVPDRFLLVPLESLHIFPDRPRGVRAVQLDMDLAELEEVPALRAGNWDAIRRTRLSSKTEEAEHVEAPSDELLLRATRLFQKELRDEQGASLGKIDGFKVDAETGVIQHAIVAFGGFLGLGEKKTAVPWELLAEQNEVCCVVQTAKEKLQGAPDYDETVEHDEQWMQRLYQFYGVEPSRDHRARWEGAREYLGAGEQKRRGETPLNIQVPRDQEVVYRVEPLESRARQDGEPIARAMEQPRQAYDVVLRPQDEGDEMTWKARIEPRGEESQGFEFSFEVDESGKIRNVENLDRDKISRLGLSPEQIRDQLAMIFGAGLQKRDLEEGRRYDLPVTDGEIEGIYSGVVSEYGRNLARIELVAKSKRQPDQPDFYEAEKTRVGEVTYRTSDGLLQEMRVEPRIGGVFIRRHVR